MTHPHTQQQMPDGTWTDARPVGYLGNALDFEVGRSGGRWQAKGYDKAELLTVVTAHTRRSLRRRMRRAAKRHGMTYTVLG